MRITYSGGTIQLLLFEESERRRSSLFEVGSMIRLKNVRLEISAGYLATLLLTCASAHGATVVTYTFDSVGGFVNAPATAASEIAAATGWSADVGTLFQQQGLPAIGFALGSGAFNNVVAGPLQGRPLSTWSDGQALHFSFNVNPGQKLDLSSVVFDERFGGNGGGNGGGGNGGGGGQDD